MEWLPITKRQPDRSMRVLVHVDGQSEFAEYEWLRCRFVINDNEVQPTHWMVPPPPPEQNK